MSVKAYGNGIFRGQVYINNRGSYEVATFSIWSANDGGKGGAYIDCEAWGDACEIAKTLQNGDEVMIDGVVNQQQWETQAGEKKRKQNVKVRRIMKVTPQATAQQGGYQTSYGDPQQVVPQQPVQTQAQAPAQPTQPVQQPPQQVQVTQPEPPQPPQDGQIPF